MKYKQVIIARSDLHMSPGKLAAQVAHGSLNSYLSTDPQLQTAWMDADYTKVVCRVKSEKALDNIFDKAKLANLSCVMIKDLGYTELAPDTKTVVAIGPAESDVIDKITKRLRLL